jgi:hypothetical protein
MSHKEKIQPRAEKHKAMSTQMPEGPKVNDKELNDLVAMLRFVAAEHNPHKHHPHHHNDHKSGDRHH